MARLQTGLRRLLSRVLPILLLTCGWGTRASAEALTEEDRSLFAWFDRLGLEDIRAKKLVRVSLGSVVYVGNKPKEVRRSDEPQGYLLWEKAGKFRVVLSDLTVATLEAEGSHPATDDEYVGWRKVSYADEAGKLLELLGKKDFDQLWENGHDGYADRLTLPAQAFALARYGAANGQDAMAARLMAGVRRELTEESKESLGSRLQSEFEPLLSWRATLAFADGRENRRTLAARFRAIAVNCPDESDADSAGKYADTLEAMAAEDDAHHQFSAEEVKHLAPAEQARELVFRLRDASSSAGDMMWSRPWPFVPAQSGDTIEPLAALGRAAAPSLLTALADERPSRCVVCNERFGGGAWVRPIQELALDALVRISGVNFLWLVPDGGLLPNAEHWEKARAIAVEWWATTEKAGEAEWLRQQITAGGWGAPDCLEVLEKRYPEQFPLIAAKSAAECHDPLVRAWLVERMRPARSPEVETFLRQEMVDGPTLGNRVAAAYVLRASGDSSSISTMIAEAEKTDRWEKLDKLPMDRSATFFRPSGLMEANPASAEFLIRFLLTADSVPAVQAIGRSWPKMSVELRSATLEFVRNERGDRDWSKQATLPTKEAIRKFLIAALADRSKTTTIYDGLKNIEIGELAAQALAGEWPKQYHFGTRPSNELERARQLKAIRKACGVSSSDT